MTRYTAPLLAFLAFFLLAYSPWPHTAGGSLILTVPSGRVGMTINPDATSPVKAPIALSVQNTAPGSCSIGDISVVGSTLKICTLANTWTAVGSQSAACRPDTVVCASGPSCCTGTCAGGLCGCYALQHACSADGDCCSASCDDVESLCCAALQAACTEDDDCCDNEDCGELGVCCRNMGDPCNVQEDCCAEDGSVCWDLGAGKKCYTL